MPNSNNFPLAVITCILSPGCKEWKNLTKHHDKLIAKAVLICRDCHDIIEEYEKVRKKARAQGLAKLNIIRAMIP